jgi:hypothetical protein
MLNEEVLDSLQKVNVNLVFYGDNITISIQRDKPIDLIYRSAYDYFKPHGKVKLYYKNRELTPFLNYTIGQFFKKLKKIDILVKDSSRMDNMFDNQLLLNSNFNFEHLNKLNSNNTLQINRTLSSKSKSNLPKNQRAMTFCWDCKKFPINIFCRDCGAFICKYCRMDFENAHYSHRTITLYPENLAKSANLYKNVLIEDLNEVEKINMNRNRINKEKMQININIEEKKNHLAMKINRLINKINQIKSYQKEINYYIKNKDKCKQKINQAIKEVNNISNEYVVQQIETTNEENNILNNNITSSKNNVKDLKEIFTKMNTIEKNTAKICKIGKTIKEWEEINRKLENALKTVENRIYMIIEEAADGEELNYDKSNEKAETNNINNIMEENEKNDVKEEKKEDEKNKINKEEKKELNLNTKGNEEKKESGNNEEVEEEEEDEEG